MIWGLLIRRAEARRLRGGHLALAGYEIGDLLDVLGCCGHQTLELDLDETSEAGVSVAVKFLGVGKRSLDGFFSAFVDGLAPRRQAMGVGAFAGILPDMAGDGALSVLIVGA